MDNPIVPYRKTQKMPDDYRALAASKGMVWIGPYPGRVTLLTEWQCSKGHKFEMSYLVLSRPTCGCTKCSRRQPEEYHDLAKKLGFVWLGPAVKTTSIKTRWKCDKGHEWEASYNALGGCMMCKWETQGNYSRRSADEYAKLASARGLIWLGPESSNVREKTKWACTHGHEFFASYNIVRRSKGCYDCRLIELSEQRRIKPEQYQAFAESIGYEWLGPEVTQTCHKTTWKCPAGHQWLAPYEQLRAGNRCPECIGLVNGRKVSKVQRTLCDMVNGVLNFKIGRCTVDVALFIGEEKIAIEYDSYFWHAKTQDNDKRRAEYMIRRGWKALSIKSNTKLPELEQIQDAIAILLNGESYCEIVMDDWAG